MSVVVKDCQNGRIILLSKGADEAILPHAFAGNRFSFSFFLVVCTLRILLSATHYFSKSLSMEKC